MNIIGKTRKGLRRLRRFLLGIISGILLGSGGVLLVKFMQSIHRQPYFVSRAVFYLTGSQEYLEQVAFNIARDNLLAGIEKRRLENGKVKQVVVAGVRNFREPWARDFGFASYGLLALDELDPVRECLEVFLHYQKPNGQFPVKIHSTNIPTRYLHSFFQREQPTSAPLRAKYISAHNTISLDGNGLLVLAALNYINQSKDWAFAAAHWPALKQALYWLGSFTLVSGGLLHQAGYSDWADSINRHGRVLYTNVIYWKALHEIALTAKLIREEQDYSLFETRADQVRMAIQDHFWRDDLGYFVTSNIFANLSSSGNLMAVAWDLASPDQADSILNAMDEFGMADPVPTRPVHRPYPWRYIAFENRLTGIGHYHTEAAWLWLGGWHVAALVHTGRLKQAQEHLDRMAMVIVRDGEVHEVYGTDGKYLSSIWYTSEAPLVWSAGMYVYAYQALIDSISDQDD
jgi:GH15 family glucan-1,4-alpha-glucosidase